jgi:predicted DNA-binding transcriptional regulator AlpA
MAKQVILHPSDQTFQAKRATQDARTGGAGIERLLTATEASNALRTSTSWLAKARMNGNGPPFIKVGRSVRYSETALLQWTRSRQRLSTSEK